MPKIQPVQREPLRFDLLQMFAAHLTAQGATLQDPLGRGEFVAHLGETLTQAVADSTLLRGLRTEALFAALAVSLGRIEFLKKEDSGQTWASRQELRIPDYRIALPDGTTFLTEVKHFYQKGSPAKAFGLSSSYVAGLRAYGDLCGCPVKLAVYWARWNLWTLVPLSAFQQDVRPSLSMIRAFKANEMGILGDLHIGTRFPPRFRVVADPARERTIRGDGEVAFTIGDVELYSGDRRLTGKTEWNIAMWLMLYGGWQEDMTAEIVDGQLVAVDIVCSPPEDHGQGFEFVGTLSSLFSSMFLSFTSDEERVTRLGIGVVGGSLGALIPDDYQSDTLPVWRLHQVQEPPHRVAEPA